MLVNAVIATVIVVDTVALVPDGVSKLHLLFNKKMAALVCTIYRLDWYCNGKNKVKLPTAIATAIATTTATTTTTIAVANVFRYRR